MSAPGRASRSRAASEQGLGQRGAVLSAWAPGKIILLGEHAVVYGEPALGMPIARGVRVMLAPGTGSVRIGSAPSLEPKVLRAQTAPSPKRLVEAALEADLGRYDATIEIEFPPMAGFGSSGALAIALLVLKQRITGRRISRSALLERAIEIENIAHGRSSGLDPAISLSNAVIAYEARGRGRPVRRIRRVKIGTNVHFVVGAAGGHGGARRSIAGFRESIARAPSLGRCAIATLGAAAREGTRALSSGDLALLGRTMNIAHGLLCCFDLVSDQVDGVVRAALDAGAIGAKMSGAGGRGGAFVALAADIRSARRVLAAVERGGAIAWIESVARNVRA